jgi:hypothetical protein
MREIYHRQGVHSACFFLTGVMFMRHGPDSTSFVKEWDAMLAASTDRVDQIAFNTLVAHHITPLRKDVHNERLATGPQRHLAVGVLPVLGFMNGHTYFVQGLHKVSPPPLPPKTPTLHRLGKWQATYLRPTHPTNVT